MEEYKEIISFKIGNKGMITRISVDYNTIDYNGGIAIALGLKGRVNIEVLSISRNKKCITVGRQK